MNTAEALRAHRLVTARMRVIRYEGSSSWTVVGVDGYRVGFPFDSLLDALTWAQEGVK